MSKKLMKQSGSNNSSMQQCDATKPKKKSAPDVFISLSPAQTTIVFDTYWKFAKLRQDVFYARISGENAPWSRDHILNTYKFTNAYRASDRVSQYLIRDVIYQGPQEIVEVFFRIILFKLFNKIETWRLLEAELGPLRWESYRFSDYDRVLTRAMSCKATIYSAAYIMASGHTMFGVQRKHQSHLKLLELLLAESVPERLACCKTMKEAFEILLSYPLIGDFLAYQLVTDINYSEITNFSEMEFTMPGPGARDGIRKCFSSLGGLSEIDIIKLMADRQGYEFDRLGLDFKSLWGRPLQLIDIQNLFCEVDKYSRVHHPEVSGISGRTRIKQKFKPLYDPITYFYPPKWQLDVTSSGSASARVRQEDLFRK